MWTEVLHMKAVEAKPKPLTEMALILAVRELTEVLILGAIIVIHHRAVLTDLTVTII